MSRQPAVAVVGGGASGLSTALCAAELGCEEVVVLERGSLASGSSGLSVGIFTRQYVDPFDIELRTTACDRLFQLEHEAGLRLVRNGFIRLAHDGETYVQFEHAAEVQRELGVEDAVALPREEIEKLIPHMECGDLAGALFSPSDGYLDGHELCTIYATRAEALGVRILTNARLLGAEEGLRHEHRLLTSVGPIECDVVVNAAGAWADRVGELLDTPVRILPQRHQVCIVQLNRPLDYLMPSVMDYIPGSGELGLYFRHEGERQLLAGLHTNEVLEHEVEDPDGYKRGTDAEYVETVAEKLLRRLPRLGDMALQGGWAGLYPASCDGAPVIGPFPERPSVIGACGLAGIGIYLSPIVGRLAAEWVVYGEPRSIAGAERLSPSRFSTVQTP